MAQGVDCDPYAEGDLIHLAVGCLHDLDFFICKVIQFIDQFVYLAVGGFDLSFEDSFGRG